MIPNANYRIARLERCFQIFVAFITGEASKIGTPEELHIVQLEFASMMEEMRKDVTEGT